MQGKNFYWERHISLGMVSGKKEPNSNKMRDHTTKISTVIKGTLRCLENN